MEGSQRLAPGRPVLPTRGLVCRLRRLFLAKGEIGRHAAAVGGWRQSNGWRAMTTLEERREWMRQGCPVEAPVPSPLPCREFRLAVDRDGKRLAVACRGCGGTWQFPGLREGTGGGDITFVTGPVNAAREWIWRHAEAGGMDRDTAQEVYKKRERQRVWGWAAAEMRGKQEAHWGGVLGLPGNGLFLHHGAPAWLEQAKVRDPVSAPPEDTDGACSLYTLSMLRTKYDGTIRARCMGCDAEKLCGAVTTNPDSGPESDVEAAIEEIAVWLRQHAIAGGMPGMYADECFAGRFIQSVQVYAWADAMLVHGDAQGHGGIAMDPVNDPHGRMGVTLDEKVVSVP